MTEVEWLACADPTPMRKFIQGRATERKLQLLACATARTYPASFLPSLDQALQAAESYADKNISADEASQWKERMAQIKQRVVEESDFEKASLARAVEYVFRDANQLELFDLFCNNEFSDFRWRTESDRILCVLLRELFGPFPTVFADPSWHTSDVLSLATGIYEERAFDRMPILADALQDAGCDNDDILNHCRQPGEHVRGCWVVDLLLGKS
jgi:hypothetical protein